MSERTEEDFKKFLGTPLERSIFRVKGREMVKYALAIGDENPKYVGVKQDENGKDDYSGSLPTPPSPQHSRSGLCLNLQMQRARMSRLLKT